MKRKEKKSTATKLRHAVWIQERIKTLDDEGGVDVTWKNIKQVYAAIYPIKAQQVFEMKTVNVEATHHIMIRGYDTISDKDNRILFGSRTFEILTAENYQERNFVQLLTCKEKR